MNPSDKIELQCAVFGVVIPFSDRSVVARLFKSINRLIGDLATDNQEFVKIWGLDISPVFRTIKDQPVLFSIQLRRFKLPEELVNPG